MTILKRACITLIVLSFAAGCGSQTASPPSPSPVSAATKADLAPGGKLRAALNLGNTVLVHKDASATAVGISVDIAKELARRLGAEFNPVEYPTVPAIMNGRETSQWDVSFLAIDPVRASAVDFTPAYMVVPNNFVVPVGSSIKTNADADQPGVRIAVAKGYAPDLFLSRNLKHAQLIRADTPDSAVALLVSGQADALATARDSGLQLVTRTPGYRVLDESYQDVMHAMALPKGKQAGLAYLAAFIEELKSSGWIQRRLQANGLSGERVAPSA